MADSNEIDGNKVYTILGNSRRSFDGQFYVLEVQGDPVNIYCTCRTDAEDKDDMTPPSSDNGMLSVVGLAKLIGVQKFYIETTGTSHISCLFKELLQ